MVPERDSRRATKMDDSKINWLSGKPTVTQEDTIQWPNAQAFENDQMDEI